jgi:hypothetical protein
MSIIDRIFSRNKPLEILVNKEEQKTGINKKLEKEVAERTRSGLKQWGEAVELAENPLFEDGIRYQELFKIYNNIEIDPHVLALRETIFNGVSQTPFTIENAPENNDIFSRSWFPQFIKYVLDAQNWSYGLINFIIENDELQVENVNRWNLRPDQKGISDNMYTEKASAFFDRPPLSNHTIFICEDNLGTYNNIAKSFIQKREVLQFWGVYNELFTTPYFIVNTDINDDTRRTNLLNWLKARRHSGFAVTGLDDKVTAITNSGQGYLSYKEFIQNRNDEMTKAFLGSTMVLEDGSSRSQAEVHERNTNAFIQAKRIEIEFLINERLIPILSRYGLIPSSAVFKWNLSQTFTPKDWSEILSKLAGYFTFDEKEISEKIGLKLTTKKAPDPVQVKPQTDEEINAKMSKIINKRYYGL